MKSECRFGYVEYDGYQYCFEHFGWRHYVNRSLRCDAYQVQLQSVPERGVAS